MASKITKRVILILLFTHLISCNVIGEKLEEVPLQKGMINSSTDMDLKQGDVITIWSKAEMKYTEGKESDFEIKYHIEKDGETLDFGKFAILDDIYLTHTISSSKNKDESYNSNSDEADEEGRVYYYTWSFERESYIFTAPDNGKYTFDFKLYEIKDDFPSDNIAIVLRKK
ncbi:hypothetical protein [Aquimarina aquimarini]|uniref:hypothetical protein n=1 Tax=Aquimarina aquimarini TaxID=1191734 RepID=UPI000D55DCC4|nr:hypothetical protein [Aquimarina aquimarini]